MSRARGFTLLEAVVALAVAGLLMAGLSSLLLYAVRSLRHFTTYNGVQQQLILATRSLHEDLSLSNTASMVLGVPDSCILGSPYDLRDVLNHDRFVFVGADLAFRSWICFYRTASGELHRAEQSMGGSYSVSAIPVGTRPLLATFTALGGTRNHIVARNLTLFKVDPTTTAATVQLSLRVTENIDSTRVTELRTTTQVRVRN
ncbi:type II secretion system protein [bacterium]|nr:type II secretion system protein [bacterium]